MGVNIGIGRKLVSRHRDIKRTFEICIFGDLLITILAAH